MPDGYCQPGSHVVRWSCGARNAQLLTTALPVMTESYSAEHWAPVLGFEGYYEVSTWGQVRSVERLITLTDHPKLKERTIKSRILKQRVNIPSKKHRYTRMQVKLWKNNKEKTMYVSRLVAEAFIPNPDNLPMVLHFDDNAENNKVENLTWGTHVENMKQAAERGRFPRGAKHHNYVHGRFATASARPSEPT